MKWAMAAFNSLKKHFVTNRMVLQDGTDQEETFQISQLRGDRCNDDMANLSQHYPVPATATANVVNSADKQNLLSLRNIGDEVPYNSQTMVKKDTDMINHSTIGILESMLDNSMANVLEQLNEVQETNATLFSEIQELKSKSKKSGKKEGHTRLKLAKKTKRRDVK